MINVIIIFRKISKSTNSEDDGPKYKIKVKLNIRVEKKAYHSQDHVIRVNGKNLTADENVSV